MWTPILLLGCTLWASLKLQDYTLFFMNPKFILSSWEMILVILNYSMFGESLRMKESCLRCENY